MAKEKKSTTMALHAKSTLAERESANRTHQTELINHTLDMASYNAHGHANGAQGRRGHLMVESDAGAQKGGYIPQAMGKDGGVRFDDDQQGAADYGVDDKTD